MFTYLFASIKSSPFCADVNNEGKPVISFFSRVVVEDSVVRFYPQVTDKSGLFLTKTFKTKVSTGIHDKIPAS